MVIPWLICITLSYIHTCAIAILYGEYIRVQTGSADNTKRNTKLLSGTRQKEHATSLFEKLKFGIYEVYKL